MDAAKKQLPPATRREFGTTEGRVVFEYALDDGEGLSAKCLDYGGAISEISFPDRRGRSANVVLGYDDLVGYETNPPWLGVLCGPVAGRVATPFEIDGTRYDLERNEPHACLHGGACDLSRRVWRSCAFREEGRVGVRLFTETLDGEGGFPGPIRIDVVYALEGGGRFAVEYEGRSEKPTLLALTSHSYFNLSGDFSRSALGQELSIDAERFLPLDAEHLPTVIADVEGTPFDFRNARAIGRDMDAKDPQIALGRGYDHAFLLNGRHQPQIVLRDPESGRSLEISTTEPCVVLYAGGFLGSDLRLRGGVRSSDHCGIAIETQWYPNAINAPFLPKRILRPGDVWRSRTEYRFRTE